MSTFLIISATSQSSCYPIVFTRLGGPRFRPNIFFLLWKCWESKTGLLLQICSYLNTSRCCVSTHPPWRGLNPGVLSVSDFASASQWHSYYSFSTVIKNLKSIALCRSKLLWNIWRNINTRDGPPLICGQLGASIPLTSALSTKEKSHASARNIPWKISNNMQRHYPWANS